VAQGGVVNAADVNQAITVLNGTASSPVILTGSLAASGGTVVTGGFSVPSGVGAILYAYKSAQTSRASTTTLANDPGLFLALEASATYIVDGYVVYSNALAAGSADIKVAFAVPAGVSASQVTMYGTSGVVTADLVTYDLTANSGTRDSPGNGATAMAFQPKASCVTTTAGNVTLQWAQNTSASTATIVQAGSWLRATRVA
jgi:hypothetical protein